MKTRTLFCFTAVSIACLVAPVVGCSREKGNANKEQSMRDAMHGKNVGPMPADVKEKMEAAMAKTSSSGLPTTVKSSH